jgi:hypothetical protein
MVKIAKKILIVKITNVIHGNVLEKTVIKLFLNLVKIVTFIIVKVMIAKLLNQNQIHVMTLSKWIHLNVEKIKNVLLVVTVKIKFVLNHMNNV